jgi:hypothetical protein
MDSGTADSLQVTDATAPILTGFHGLPEEGQMETIPSAGQAKSHRKLFGHTRLVNELRHGHPQGRLKGFVISEVCHHLHRFIY